jgi:DNA-binding transcriptional LysR family regulator
MINTRTFDLNLIRVFSAILRHGSVSAAANELNLTQSGLSNALTRLRNLTGDDLFVRTRDGMKATNYALQMAESFNKGLELINHGLSHSRSYDPATSQRRFTLLMTDAGEMVFLPNLMKSLTAMAPHVSIEVRQFSSDDYVDALEGGGADVAIGNVRAIHENLYYSQLFEDPYVLVCRRGHPLFKRNLSMVSYLQAEHVLVSPPNSPANAAVMSPETGRDQRRIALRVPHFMVLGSIVAGTDLVATVTKRVARAISSGRDTRILELPFQTAPVTIGIAWHRRYHHDAGNLWLRRLIVKSARKKPDA